MPVPFAQNYNPEATTDDGSCQFPEGCAEETACGLVYDGNNDGVVGSGDLLQLLTEFGQTCTPLHLRRSHHLSRLQLRDCAHWRPVLVRGKSSQHAVHERRQPHCEFGQHPMDDVDLRCCGRLRRIRKHM